MTTCQITDVQRVLLGIVDGPAHEDPCNHGEGEYQFTVHAYGRTVDVYMFDYPSGRQGVCLRRSGECSDYSSGQVEWFLRGMHCEDDVARMAMAALLATHHVRLTPRAKANN